MPVCSYVVVPRQGRRDEVRRHLARLPGCEVAGATNADVLLLVTTTPSFDADMRLRWRVEQLAGIQALLMTFGEVDPETPVADPVRRGRDISLPVVPVARRGHLSRSVDGSVPGVRP